MKWDDKMRYWADIYSDGILIGNCRKQLETINLDTNKIGRTRTYVYYNVAWDQDAFKSVYGVPANNMRTREGYVNSFRSKTIPSPLKIQRYITASIEMITKKVQ